MMTIAAVTLLAISAILLTACIAHLRFQSRVCGEVATLFSEQDAAIGSQQLAARRDKLPEPVRRYLHFAITDAAAPIRTVRLTHGGLFRTKPNQHWQSIKGEEYFTVANPGFVWNASIAPVPFLRIVARDRLQSGRGNMLVKINSLLTIANASGPEIDQGASLRWLAEAIWFPYAFVGDHIRWDEIDDHSARATLVQGGLSVSAIFDFDNDGKLMGMNASRYRDLGNGRSVLTPWTARCSEYDDFSGFRAPTVVDVAWEIEQQRFSYAHFRVITLEYNVAERFP